MEFKEPNGPVFSYGDQLRNLATAAAQISPDQWEAGLNNRRGHPLYQKIKETAQQGGFSLYKDIEGGGIKKKSGGKDQFQLSQVHAGVFFPSLLDPESKYCIEANYQIIIPSDIAETTGVGRMYLTVAGHEGSGLSRANFCMFPRILEEEQEELGGWALKKDFPDYSDNGVLSSKDGDSEEEKALSKFFQDDFVRDTRTMGELLIAIEERGIASSRECKLIRHNGMRISSREKGEKKVNEFVNGLSFSKTLPSRDF